jgi:hypothetical protein
MLIIGSRRRGDAGVELHAYRISDSEVEENDARVATGVEA